MMAPSKDLTIYIDSTRTLSQTFPSTDGSRYTQAPSLLPPHAFPPPLPPSVDQLNLNHRTTSRPVMHRNRDTPLDSAPNAVPQPGPIRSPLPSNMNGNGVALQSKSQFYLEGLNQRLPLSPLPRLQKRREESLSSEYSSGEDPFA